MSETMIPLPPPPTTKTCPECGTVFVGGHLKLRCSRACTDRANHRNWRHRKPLRQQEGAPRNGR